MKLAAFLTTTVTALVLPASAQNQTQLASTRAVYECSSSGCVVSCKNATGVWVELDHAINYVYMDSYVSGNTKFTFEDGSRGVRTYMLSPANLPCKVDGQR
ncbi:hypothetical protein HH213_02765 [Duganella dendranthematis]|uniref:C-type lysozyme inhibitor domain-containing protein n=1 Tax=Duganella dendranthematis TaxID=2728021 RepID=A0ABX6M8I3_9BURK|nr:hypothetical protein [Duganella dendranthematis]QJD89132.1 hypothetical protein HH213_02765 [Duganella dendranthematis]